MAGAPWVIVTSRTLVARALTRKRELGHNDAGASGAEVD
jgi:hypothetical protein